MDQISWNFYLIEDLAGQFCFFWYFILLDVFFLKKKKNKTIELGLTVTSLVFLQYLGSYKTNPGNVQCTVHEIPH